MPSIGDTKMAIKVSNVTVIDDTRKLLNIAEANLTGENNKLSIFGTNSTFSVAPGIPGTLDNVVIGTTGAAPGYFTDLSANQINTGQIFSTGVVADVSVFSNDIIGNFGQFGSLNASESFFASGDIELNTLAPLTVNFANSQATSGASPIKIISGNTGTIDNMTIGSLLPADAYFTTINATSNLEITTPNGGIVSGINSPQIIARRNNSQYLAIRNNDSDGSYITSFSATNNSKGIIIDATTNSTHAVPTDEDSNRIDLAIRNNLKLRVVNSELLSTVPLEITAAGTAAGMGQIYLNGATRNRIDFNINGIGAPVLGTANRSAGAKLVLYPTSNGMSTDYAIGIEDFNLWFSTSRDQSNFGFKWYGGSTNIMSLSGTGNLSYTATNAKVTTLTSPTAAMDLQTSDAYMITVTAPTTFSFTNPPASGRAKYISLEIVNGGSFTVFWPTGTRWPSGIAPSLTTNGTDIVVFYTDDGGINYRAALVQRDSK